MLVKGAPAVDTCQGYFSVMFLNALLTWMRNKHDDVIKWKHFPRYWPFVLGIHQSPVNSPHKGQWRGALMFSLICGWIDGWVNNREAGDLRRHRAHYDVTIINSVGGLHGKQRWWLTMINSVGGLHGCVWEQNQSSSGISHDVRDHAYKQIDISLYGVFVFETIMVAWDLETRVARNSSSPKIV